MRRPPLRLVTAGPEASASRPPALGPAAFNGWTMERRRAAEAALDLRVHACRVRSTEARRRGQKSRRWSAAGRVRLTGRTPRPKRGLGWCASRCSIPLDVFRGEQRRACPGPRQRIRAMALVWREPGKPGARCAGWAVWKV